MDFKLTSRSLMSAVEDEPDFAEYTLTHGVIYFLSLSNVLSL